MDYDSGKTHAWQRSVAHCRAMSRTVAQCLLGGEKAESLEGGKGQKGGVGWSEVGRQTLCQTELLPLALYHTVRYSTHSDPKTR